MAEAWPAVLKPTSGGFFFENPSRGGGPALNGSEQTVASPSARWRARWAIRITSDDQVLALRALLDALQGRANSVLVPTFDGRRLSWPVDAYERVLHPGFTRRKQLNGTEYEDPAIPAASAISATVNASVAVGVTQMVINRSQGEPFKAGQYFGIGENLYRITRIVANFVGSQTVDFFPRLRVAASAGATVAVTRPVCRMKQLSDESALQDLEMLRYADVTLEFREDF